MKIDKNRSTMIASNEMENNSLLIGMYIFGLLILLALVIFEYPDYKKYREELKRKSGKK